MVATVKKIFSLFLFLLCLSCCQQKSYYLGFLGSFSNDLIQWSVSARDGVELAMKEFNEAHPATRIELVQLNDLHNPVIAKEEVKRFQKIHNSFGLIGPLSSTVAIELRPTLNEYQLTTISPICNVDPLKEKDDYFFTLNTKLSTLVSDTFAMIAAESTVQTKIAVLFQNTNSSYFFTDYLQEAKKTFQEKGYENILYVPITENIIQRDKKNLDFIRQVEDFDPKIVVIIANETNTAYLAQFLRQSSTDISFFGVETALNQKLIEYGGSAVEGMKFSTTLNFSSSLPEISDFFLNYRKNFDRDATPYSYLSYQATKNMLNAGLKSNFHRKKIRSRLLLLKENVGGEEKEIFNQYGDRERPIIRILLTKGHFEIIDETL